MSMCRKLLAFGTSSFKAMTSTYTEPEKHHEDNKLVKAIIQVSNRVVGFRTYLLDLMDEMAPDSSCMDCTDSSSQSHDLPLVHL